MTDYEYLIASTYKYTPCAETDIEKVISEHKQRIEEDEIVQVFKLYETFRKITLLKKI